MKDIGDKLDTWLAPHFSIFTEDAKRLRTLLYLSVDGIGALTVLPRFGELASKAEKLRGLDATGRELERANRAAELAAREVDEGFPITHSQFLVDIWGLLEASVRGFITVWLKNVPAAMKVDAIIKLRVRVGEYEAHTGNARYYFITKLLERELGVGLKSGISRFESLLGPFGLDGKVPNSLQRTIFELAQLRNCIVHSARRVDSQLVESCPWLDITEGDLIKVSSEQAEKSYRAVMDYSVILLSRACIWHGRDLSGNIDQVFSDWHEEVHADCNNIR